MNLGLESVGVTSWVWPSGKSIVSLETSHPLCSGVAAASVSVAKRAVISMENIINGDVVVNSERICSEQGTPSKVVLLRISALTQACFYI